VVRVKPAIS